MSKRFIIRDPFSLHREGVLKSRGYVAWKNNIYVAIAVSDLLKPCLGPRGMSKLVIDKFGEAAVTNHGAQILEKLDIHHPIAKLLREASKTVDTTAGDGTKTAIILIGELLKKAEELENKRLKIDTIIQGYLMAYKTAINKLRTTSISLNGLDYNIVKKAVASLFLSRSRTHTELMSTLASQAITSVLRQNNGKTVLDRESVKILKKAGGTITDCKVIGGIIIDKGVAHPAMPRVMKNPRIALLNMALKLDEFRHLQPYKYHIDINNPDSINHFLKEEEALIRNMVEKLLAVGANVVICRKRMGDIAKHLLARHGIIGVSRLLNEKEFTYVAKITGAKVISSIDNISAEDLGKAELIREDRIGSERLLIIEGCSGGITVLLRGFSENLLNDVEHTFNDSLVYVSSLLEGAAYVSGGGAVEETLAVAIRKEGLQQAGKLQEAIFACAEAFESIPRLLAENSGQDQVEVLAKLRSWHEKGKHSYGFDAVSGQVCDTLEAGIIESFKMKEQVLKTAFETAIMILRIDELVDRRYAKRHAGELGGD